MFLVLWFKSKMEELVFRAECHGLLLKEGGSINNAQARQVWQRYGVWPVTRGIRKRTQAAKLDLPWPTKATLLSCDGNPDNLKKAVEMTMEFVRENGTSGAAKPKIEQDALRKSQQEAAEQRRRIRIEEHNKRMEAQRMTISPNVKKQ